MDKPQFVPTATFRSTDFKPSETFRAWAEFVRTMYQLRPLGEEGAPHDAVSDSWVIGDLIIGRSSFDAQIMDRRRGREITDATRRFLFLLHYHGGSSQVVHDGEPLELRHDVIYALDYTREIRSISTTCDVDGVAVPHRSVGYDPAVHPPRFRFDLDSAAGRLLHEMIDSIIGEAPNLTVEEAPSVADFFTGALTGLIRNYSDGRAGGSPALHTVRDYVDTHLFEKSLSAAHLTRTFGISRATLYRQFESFGGLKTYIERRRLDYALRSLAFGPAKRGRIAEIAELTGYSSANLFSRAFSRHFGFSPSNALQAFANDPVASRGGANAVWETWHGRPA